ncbi:sialidase family protein [Maribacter halichondriae]|uniref:sialidase family protein n=1 Tax=Maribacter halichondriae TaxID=2980554 RepID=UPI002359D3ED|nr:sialidase family protein [Maribacter sp. Hal144]
MRSLLSILFVLLTANGLCQTITDQKFIDLSNDSSSVSIPFYGGLNGYYAYRIPTIIKTKTTLVVFAEGRKNSTSDFGDIDLVYRRSLDKGRTWEPLQVLHDLDTLAVQNPVPIYVAKENKIVLLFNTTSLSEHDILNKEYGLKNERKAFLTSSSDDGKTWDIPKDITRQVKRKTWRWHALGPVHGIQLQYGRFAGRLVAPVAISIEKGNTAYCMALVYSDDQGTNWKIGAVDENISDAVRANETTISELNDGRIYVNTRDHKGGSAEKNRGETLSIDGGLTFEKPIVESDKFPSPIVQSALLSYNDRVFFSTPSSYDKRENLIIMVSHDHTETWLPFYKVHNGFSAYSDMVQLDENTLGVIYETDEYKKIRFRSIVLE